MRVLFVCSQNKFRSPTAEVIFSAWPGVEAASAGTDSDAVTPLSEDLIEWADVIFAMEDRHRQKIRQRFGKQIAAKRVIVLRIPDRYAYMDAELIQILNRKVVPYLKG
jgi:predicted protein tyrosine phosphatase